MIKYVVFLLFSLSLFSCTLTKYYPSPVATPMLSDKNEIKMTAGVPGYFSAAYSPAENFGIYTSAFFISETLGSGFYEQTGNHFMWEVAGGYYKKQPNNFVFELYGGLGLGRFDVKEKGEMENFRFKIPTTKLFVNPGIAWKKNHFEAAVNFRITGLSYGSYSTNYSVENIDDNGLGELNKGMAFFAEPALTLSFGLENVKFNYQSGFSMRFGEHHQYTYSPAFGYFGVSVNLNRKK